MKISLIIPIVEAYIEKCLYSVIQQTLVEGVECILVNDCTPDNSMKVVENILSGYTGPLHFHLIEHKRNQGLSAARNTGLKAATGDYVYFLDSDDEIMPECLQRFVSLLEQYPTVDFIIGGVKVSGSDVCYPLLSKPYLEEDAILEDYIFQRWNTMAWNKLIRRDFLLDNHLFFVEGRLHEDLMFSFELALRAKQMACLYVPTYHYKIRGQGAITSELGLRNLCDIMYGIEHNLCLVRENISNSTHLPIYDYVINSVFHFIHLLYKSSLEKSDKKKLYEKVRQIEQECRDYRYSVRVKTRMKCILLNCSWLANSMFRFQRCFF